MGIREGKGDGNNHRLGKDKRSTYLGKKRGWAREGEGVEHLWWG